MFEVFKYVDKFFTSLTNYLTYNDIFLIFVGLFLLTTIVVFVSTSGSYEAKLIKAIDKFNTYFIDNPQINDENLVAFNARMKSKAVPKQLRKSWQQFVLYREHKASTYMSFENCVSNPIKNSSYKRDTKLMNILSFIFSFCALILNCYYCYETADLASVLSSVLLTPTIILLLNFIVQIFFHVKHSAIVSDLFQNYQYFEVNIDKATETLPDYVNYEVLFDRNEIKKGIPILYAYLQKRAEEEQRELERARLKNVEHEKFNFDDTGVEASLVLERAMQEAENYIAERKKFLQDSEQINSDITQEDMNYREITKEYNRQMQVSKETFANFKSQLENVSSSIEANYLKKQQQQELDRQRNLERDFDTATERHKKIVEGFQEELDTVDKFIAESRKNLEKAMKSEFATYSAKVYDEAKKVVDEREKEKYQKLKKQINDLEEQIVAKNQEIEKAYQQNQELTEKLENLNVQIPYVQEVKPIESVQPEAVEELPQEEPVAERIYQPLTYEEPSAPAYETYTYDNAEQESYEDQSNQEDVEPVQEETYAENDQFLDEYASYAEYADDVFDDQEFDDFNEEFVESEKQEQVEDVKDLEKISTEPTDDGIKIETLPKENLKKVQDEPKGEKKTRGRGRPRKQVQETTQTKRSVGRPRKTEEKPAAPAVKRGRGRPKKVQTQAEKTIKAPSKGRGRPRKQVQETAQTKRSVGRPRKTETKPVVAPVKKGRGRPKKVQTQAEKTVKTPSKGRGRPRKQVQNNNTKKKVDSIVDIDAYLKQIDNEIAQENAKLAETQKELAKDAKLRRKK